MSGGNWTLRDAPRLDGRRAVVTGSTGGLGYEVARGLLSLGARVVVSGRDAARGAAAVARLRQEHPAGTVSFERLDLGSLAAVRDFADRLLAADDTLDILVNNAGIMALPRREVTPDGFEAQFGTNYLGHYALTAWLMPALLRSRPEARVVELASLAHRRGRIDFDDLQGARNYGDWAAYQQSKLAMLLFARALARRAAADRWPVRSVAAHPGWSVTNIITSGPGRGQPAWKTALMNTAFGLLAQSAEAGALPVLFAATAPEAEAGGYYGPRSFGETRGGVGPSRVAPQGADRRTEDRLWQVSKELTGVSWPGAA